MEQNLKPKQWWFLNCRTTRRGRADGDPALGLALVFGVVVVGIALMLATLAAPHVGSAIRETASAVRDGVNYVRSIDLGDAKYAIAPALIEARNKLKAKQDEIGKVFEEAGSDLDFSKVKCLTGDSTQAKVEKFRTLNSEANELGIEVERWMAIEQAGSDQKRREQLLTADPKDFRQPFGDPSREPAKPQEIGDFFVTTDHYKQYKASGGNVQMAQTAKKQPYNVEMKTLFQTSAGWAPESLRTGRLVEIATRPIQLIDVMPMENTDMAAIKYMEETTFTNNAAEKAEGAAYAENAFALTERSIPVEKITAFLPVTDEQLEDEPRAASFINNRMPFTIRQRLDSQILNGTGVTPLLMGILNKPNIQTQAKGADPVPDAVRKAMTKVRVTGRANPNVIIMHPNDWQDVRLLRTAEGIYIWGSPAETGPQRMWGLPVIEGDAITEGTGLVGDFANFAALVTRRGIEVQVGYINDDFKLGQRSIRADMRCALAWYRAAAFATVTGI